MPGGVGISNPGAISGGLARVANQRGGAGSAGSSGSVTDIAGLTRADWQHFLDFYRPQEDEVLRRAMQTDFSAEGDQAGATASANVKTSRGILSRNLSRSGTSLTPEERAAVNRRQGTSLSRAVGQAENVTRRGLSDSRTNLLQQVVGIGRGVAATASSGLNSVADMAAQREAEHQQNRANATSTNINALSSAAALIFAI